MSTNTNPKMSIVVVSCDAYQDIAAYYLHYLSVNWSDCPYPVAVAMETVDLHSPVAQTLVCGADTTWTQRAIQAVQAMPGKYILLTVDDLYMSKPVSSAEFDKVLDFMEKEDIRYYRIPTFHATRQKPVSYPGNDNVEQIPKNRVYGVTFGSSIWAREELLKVLGDGSRSAWDLENDFSAAAVNAGEGYLEKYVADKRRLLHSVHMAKGGKWLPDAVKTMKKLGYDDIDYSKRGMIPLATNLRFKVNMVATGLCPTRLRKPLKKFLKKLGFQFATEN